VALLFLVGLVLVAPALIRRSQRFSLVLAASLHERGQAAWRQGNIVRQPSRSAITASATMIGLAIVVSAGGMMYSMSESVFGLFNSSMKSDYLMIPPSVSVWKGNLGASQSLANKLRSVLALAR